MRFLILFLSVSLAACSASDPLGVLEGGPSGPEVAVKRSNRPPANSTPENKTEPVEDDLGLADCIDRALRRNPRTRAAYNASRAAAANVGAAKGAWLPTADLGLNTGVSGNPGGSMNSDTGASASVGFTVRYLLYDGGARRGRLEGARADLRAADFRHRTVLLNVALEVQEAWYGLQGALWYRSVVDEIIRQAKYQLDLARARHEVGLARKYDLVQARAKLAETELLKTAADSQVRQQRAALARAMGLDVRMELSIQSLPEDQAFIPLADVGRLVDAAVRHRPEIGEARSRIDRALADARIARAGHAPAIDLSASVSRNHDTRTDPSNPWQVGAGLSLPVFSGYEPTYNVRRATYNERKARAELASQVSDIQFEVWTAHAITREAIETVAAARKVLEAAEEAVTLAEENYKNGLGTIGEVFDAQAARANARLELVRARVAGFLALARLERAVGRVLAGPGGDVR